MSDPGTCRRFAGRVALLTAAASGTALMRQLAVEYAPDVRCNSIAPGAVLTALWEGVPERDREDVAARTPLARLGSADDIAGAVAFLASSDAAFVTGATLVVDGGRTIAERV